MIFVLVDGLQLNKLTLVYFYWISGLELSLSADHAVPIRPGPHARYCVNRDIWMVALNIQDAPLFYSVVAMDYE